jgi:hypothetical protein
MSEIPDFNMAPATPEDMPRYKEALAQAAGTGGLLGVALPHWMSVTEMLNDKKAHLEYQLQVVNDALAKAKEQQGAMDLIDAIARTNVKDRY